MFLRKNGRIEKNSNSFAAAHPEKQAPPLLSTRLSSEFQQLYSPNLLIEKK